MWKSMSEQPVETPKGELECKSKYLYEYSMFWECKEHSKNQILEEDVCDLLNNFSSEIEELNISISLFEDDVARMSKKIGEQQATITALKEENEQLRQKLKSVTMLKDDYEELIESFEKKYGRNIEDVIDDE